jgi:hypothetical protein
MGGHVVGDDGAQYFEPAVVRVHVTSPGAWVLLPSPGPGRACSPSLVRPGRSRRNPPTRPIPCALAPSGEWR